MKRFEQVTAALEASHQAKIDDLRHKYEGVFSGSWLVHCLAKDPTNRQHIESIIDSVLSSYL